MTHKILFIQGGGDDGYTADQALADSLRTALGKEYEVSYPELVSDDTQPDFGWTKQIADKISAYKDDVIVVAHSFGASILLKYISEHETPEHIKGIFLLAAPFWDGKEDWQEGFLLEENFAAHLPKAIPLHFYHCKDDEEVPFAQFEQYRKKIKHAAFHEIKTGGHQFSNDLKFVAEDIRLFDH